MLRVIIMHGCHVSVSCMHPSRACLVALGVDDGQPGQDGRVLWAAALAAATLVAQECKYDGNKS